MKLAIIYSSQTGNTKKLAIGIANELKAYEPTVINLNENNNIPDADIYLVGFWNEKGEINEVTKNTLKNLPPANYGFFGTMGAYPYGLYMTNIQNSVINSMPNDSELIGFFMCQGPIDPISRTKSEEIIGKDTQKIIIRNKIADDHPNDLDIKYVSNMFKERIDAIKKGIC